MNEQLKFLSTWVVNSILLLFLSGILKNKIVLGNSSISSSLAAILAGFILTGFIFLIPVGLKKADLKIKNDYALSGIVFVVSFIVIWVVKRLANVTGLGMSSIFYVFILAVLVTVVAWGIPKVDSLVLKGNSISKKG